MTGPKNNLREATPMSKKQRKFSLGAEMLKKLRRKSGDPESTTPDLLASSTNNPTIASTVSGDASDPINLCSTIGIHKPPLHDAGSIHKHLSQTLRIISTGFCKHVVYGGYIYKNRYVTVPQLHKMLTEIETKLQQGRLQTPDLTRSKITPENTPLLIIDARRPDEYAISHIPGAVNIHTLLARRVSRYLQNVDLTTPVLTYCAAGLRSGWLASRLRSLGFKNVKTLEGAFYQWASDGRPMVGESGEVVAQVLPQHFLAAFLLEKQIRTVAKKAVEEIEEHLPIAEPPRNSMHFSEPLFKEEKVESASVTRNHSITIC